MVWGSPYLSEVEQPAGVDRLTGCDVGKECSREGHSLVTRTLTHQGDFCQGSWLSSLCLTPWRSAEGRGNRTSLLSALQTLPLGKGGLFFIYRVVHYGMAVTWVLVRH